MRQFIRLATILLVCSALCLPSTEARGRSEHNNNRQQRSEIRNDRSEKANGHKKGHKPPKQHHDNKRRPDCSDHHSLHHTQGTGHAHGFRPPSHSGNRHHGLRPTPKPHHHGRHHGHFINYGCPHRPHMYPPRPFRRPTPPPPAWRPHKPWHPFSTILGITLGTAINLSVSSLLDSGYDVYGYDNDIIYLSNVPMLNLRWPVANLYYNRSGRLYGSEFIISTPRPNMNRYNDAFRILTANYGTPYSVRDLNDGGRTAVWWGDGGQYITLTFSGKYANNGSLRYFTVLSFGK